MKNTKNTQNAKRIVSIATSLLLGLQIVAPAVIAIPAALTTSALATTSVFAVNNSLIGCLDIAEIIKDGNILHVRGWAMDLRQNGPINVHFYVVMKDGREILVEGTLACDGRPDVCIVKNRPTSCGYGYDRTFQIPAGVDVFSIVGVRAYGIDPQNVENQLISAKPIASTPATDTSLNFPLRGNIARSSTAKTNGVYCDYKAPKNTPVYAPANGTVTFYQTVSTSTNRLASYGNQIVFQSTDGTSVRMAHLSSFVGAQMKYTSSLAYPCSASKYKCRTEKIITINVQKGQLIGYTGSTGNASGPHLHIEVTKGGKALNPTSVFKTW